MKPNTRHGIKRILSATKYSIKGFYAAWKNEAAFREEAIAAFILIPVAFLLPVTIMEKILLLSTVFLVVIIEMINSAIEAAIDRIGTENHELSGRAKDMGSSAVFLGICLAIIVWGLIIGNLFL